MNGPLKDQPEHWRIATNNRYNKIVASVFSLATGSLVLPVLFLRIFLAFSKASPCCPFSTGGTMWAGFVSGFQFFSA
jgi:hypothetical protein